MRLTMISASFFVRCCQSLIITFFWPVLVFLIALTTIDCLPRRESFAVECRCFFTVAFISALMIPFSAGWFKSNSKKLNVPASALPTPRLGVWPGFESRYRSLSTPSQAAPLPRRSPVRAKTGPPAYSLPSLRDSRIPRAKPA